MLNSTDYSAVRKGTYVKVINCRPDPERYGDGIYYIGSSDDLQRYFEENLTIFLQEGREKEILKIDYSSTKDGAYLYLHAIVFYRYVDDTESR